MSGRCLVCGIHCDESQWTMACSEEHAAELEEETRLVERGLLMEEEQDCFEEDECPGCSRCRLAEFRRNSNVMLWETL